VSRPTAGAVVEQGPQQRLGRQAVDVGVVGARGGR
jgi:hypothetical protein